jgi:hypothetical protein
VLFANGYHSSDSMDDMKEVDLGPHPGVVDGVLLVASFIFRHSPSSLQGPRHGDFTLVDAERPDDSRNITIIAGPEEAKIQLPRILTCTMSPTIADMLQKALKQQKKKLGALEHVPQFEGGLALLDDENTLDFASHGQARLRNPTIFLRDANPAAIRALAYWLSNPKASMLSDQVLRRMLLFDLAGKHKDNCWCGRVMLRTSGTLSPSICCPRHDPAVAISLICFAEEFQMAKLQHEITKCLLISCGIDQVVEEQAEMPKLPHSIAFQRWVPEKSNFKDTIQYFRLSLTKDAAKKGFKELTGGEYEVSRLRKGAWKDTGCVVERKVSFCGGFEVYFDVHHVNQESLVSKLKRAVLGE